MEPGIFFLRADRLPGLSPSRMRSKTIGGRFFSEFRSGPASGFQAPGYFEGWGISQETLGFSPV
jgi:hypothetical protein